MFDYLSTSISNDVIPDIGCMPIKLTCDCDMSAAWKGLQRGGAALQTRSKLFHVIAVVSEGRTYIIQ
jgi:hypothetical protein